MSNGNYLLSSPGQMAILKIKFGRNGRVYDPFVVGNVSILNPSDDIVTTLSPTKLSTGIYSVQYPVPIIGPIGFWKHRWSSTAFDGASNHYAKYIFNVAPSTSSASYSIEINVPYSEDYGSSIDISPNQLPTSPHSTEVK